MCSQSVGEPSNIVYSLLSTYFFFNIHRQVTNADFKAGQFVHAIAFLSWAFLYWFVLIEMLCLNGKYEARALNIFTKMLCFKSYVAIGFSYQKKMWC